MSFNFNKYNQKVKEIENHLIYEYQNIRAGRASLSFLDKVKVDAYGDMNPLQNVASMSLEDARTIRISPWDNSLIKAIEKGIIIADLGVSVVPDGSGLRVIFPELTGEKRLSFVKIAKEKFEEAKVLLRKERSENIDELDKKKKEGILSEDEVIRYKKELEKNMENSTSLLENHFIKKEKEITNQ